MLAELSIVGIIIAVIVAIVFSFLKNKRQDEEWELPPELKPRADKPEPRPAARNWEEELRRVLEERPAPPPIIRREPPPPPPQVEGYESPTEVVPPTRHPHIEPVFHSFAGLTESTQRMAQATSIDKRVQERFHYATTHRVGTTSVQHAELAPEIRELLKSVHSSKGARSAVLASVILGPPRAFDT